MMKEEIMERAKYNRMILDEFMKVNSSVVILDVETGDQDDTSVPCERGRWLKVITKNHGWLHVYLNKDTGKLEWY